VAALMLLAYYDRAFGYHRLIKSVQETKTGMPEELILKLRAEIKTANFSIDGVQYAHSRDAQASQRLTAVDERPAHRHTQKRPCEILLQKDQSHATTAWHRFAAAGKRFTNPALCWARRCRPRPARRGRWARAH
jgi:uncharacterized glyoxalase superfamily protein PhnB